MLRLIGTFGDKTSGLVGVPAAGAQAAGYNSISTSKVNLLSMAILR
jgi:hypothetical protein